MASGDNRGTKFECRPQNPCMLIRKLVDLMDHPISERSTKRQLQLLEDFLNVSHYAFWLLDIPYIIRLYEIIVKKLDVIPQFIQPLECLLHFSAFPPMMTKISDKLQYDRDLVEYFSVLGYLILCLPNNALKKLVLATIKRLLQPNVPPGYCCVPLTCLNEAVERSRLPEILAQLTEVVDDAMYPLVVDLMFVVCQISSKTCEKMLSENPVEFLLQRLDPKWRERNRSCKQLTSKDDFPYLEDTCCVLWKLLNMVNQSNAKTPTKAALSSLQYAFHWTNINTGQKFNRNNLAAITLKILVAFPELDFCSNDISQDIITHAIASASSCGLFDKQIKYIELDFHFKKIIWSCLHFLTREKTYKDINGNDIVRAFIKNLTQPQPKSKSCMEETCEVSKILLKLIPKFLPTAEPIFTHFEGTAKIIQMIERYPRHPYEIEILEAHIYCLFESLLLRIENIIYVAREQRGVDIVTAVCNRIMENRTLTATQQKILARSFCILQILDCPRYSTRSDVINLCVNFLHRVIHPSDDDPPIDIRAIICATRLLWKGIVMSRSFYREFLRKGGIYVMLDITEKCTLFVKSVALGVLADIALKPSCVPFLITWRKNGRNLIPMLLETFRNKSKSKCEEAIDIYKETPENVWSQVCQTKRTALQNSCVSIDDLMKMCRSRIHGIIYCVKSKFKWRVHAANEYYKLFNTKLETDDQLTMLFAENFVSLSMCQMWLNVSKELQNEGVILVETDNIQMEERKKDINQWKLYLQRTIDKIIYKEFRAEKYKELELYVTLNESRLSDALDALDELNYISNGTERMFQMRKKILLERQVSSAPPSSAHFHQTMWNIQFSKIYNQNINIQSNIIYEKKEEHGSVTPVSLEEEEQVVNPTYEHPLNEPELTC